MYESQIYSGNTFKNVKLKAKTVSNISCIGILQTLRLHYCCKHILFVAVRMIYVSQEVTAHYKLLVSIIPKREWTIRNQPLSSHVARVQWAVTKSLFPSTALLAIDFSI